MSTKIKKLNFIQKRIEELTKAILKKDEEIFGKFINNKEVIKEDILLPTLVKRGRGRPKKVKI